MRALKLLGGVVVALLVLIIGTIVTVRFLDGPVGPIQGGPLRAGSLAEAPPADWEFASSIETIELQLAADETSRTTWILVREGRAFVPCSVEFPPGKEWHHRAVRDGRSILRVEGTRYPVNLKRVEDTALVAELKGIGASKYAGGPPGDGEIWFFAIEARTP